MAASLAAARIVFDERGVPRSTEFDDVYHSADGGPEQARHVFLGGNDLPARWCGRERFTIVETGFGLGLNFLCTAQTLLESLDAPRCLHYIGIEKHPARAGDLARAHARWPQLQHVASELRRGWPPPLAGFHRIALARGRIRLTLLFGDAVPMLAELHATADALFLDGFAPARNPAMWTEPLFAELARLSAPGTTAATWTVAAAVRAGFRTAGFETGKRVGFGRKREMLVAVRPGAPGREPAPPRDVAIVGAGLAGCWLAFALARRGFRVTQIERRPAPAREASGNAIGVLRPLINRADNANARLARSGFLHAGRILAEDVHDDGHGPRVHERCGVLHIAADAAEAARLQQDFAAHRYPVEYLRWVDAGEAARLAARPVAGAGYWIPGGGWVAPQALCGALLAQAGSRLRGRFGAQAGSITPTTTGWRIADACGTVLAEAPLVVVATGLHLSWLGLPHPPLLHPVRGQVTFLPCGGERRLDVVVGGDGFVAPAPGGGHCLGATFEPDRTTTEVRADGHALNLARAGRLLPGFAAGVDPEGLAGWSGVRAATSDRLPACGALALCDTDAPPGLYLAAGMGARGLVWAPLCAEVLASRLNGEPNPVEASLAAALAPTRLLPGS